MTHTRRTLVLATMGAACMIGLAIGGRGAEAAGRTFVMEQQAPVLDTIDLRDAGHTNGDMLAFEASVTADDGTAGTLRGILITVDLPDDAGDVFEDRIRPACLRSQRRQQHRCGRRVGYAKATTEMKTEQAQIRAVVGGTGTFLGARGQVTTTRNADGTYEHRFELMD